MSSQIKWLDRDGGPVNYGEPTYWERRYELDRKEFGTSYRHDWFFGFDKLKAVFESYFGQPKGQRILIIGCGLSTIASQLHALGYSGITAIDISATAIGLMQAGDQEKEGIEYAIGDARKMDSLPDNLFDGIFDKGCADSLICGYRSTDDVVDMFHECCRVLRPSGVFLCVSHGAPDARMYLFEHKGLQWLTNVVPMHGSEGLSVYVSTKWTQEEIQASERQRLDDIESTLSMRTRSTYSHSTRSRRGIMHENLIVNAMAPHEMEAAKLKREKEAAQLIKVSAIVTHAEAKAAAEAAATTAAELNIIPFEADAPTRQGTDSRALENTDSSSTPTAIDASIVRGVDISTHGAIAMSARDTAVATSAVDRQSSGSDDDGLSMMETGSLPTAVRGITSATQELPANNVVASG